MKQATIKLLVTAFFAVVFIGNASAQTYQIRTVNKGNGILGVELRCITGTAPTTTNNITDMVFGLKWNSSYNVDLSSTITTTYNIKKAGAKGTKGTFNYQAFYADNTPYRLPVSWTLNNWFEVMSIDNNRAGTGTGNFEICETGFDVTTDANLGIDLVDKAPAINGLATGVILPVNWLSFGLTPVKAAIQLSWSTILEQNNKGFDLQRSLNDNTGFITIGWVAANAAHPNGTQYNFTDSSVLPNVRYYYRLKQIDKEGNSNYSEIRTAILKELNTRGIKLAPNPIKDLMTIFIEKSILSSPASIVVIDSKGTEINRQMVAELQAGNNYKIDLSRFSSGMYCVVIRDGNNVLFYNQVLKQ